MVMSAVNKQYTGWSVHQEGGGGDEKGVFTNNFNMHFKNIKQMKNFAFCIGKIIGPTEPKSFLYTLKNGILKIIAYKGLTFI